MVWGIAKRYQTQSAPLHPIRYVCLMSSQIRRTGKHAYSWVYYLICFSSSQQSSSTYSPPKNRNNCNWVSALVFHNSPADFVMPQHLSPTSATFFFTVNATYVRDDGHGQQEIIGILDMFCSVPKRFTAADADSYFKTKIDTYWDEISNIRGSKVLLLWGSSVSAGFLHPGS